MKWIEKKVRHADANITQTGKTWTARVRFKLPDGTLFERELTAKTAARGLRDDLYAAYNALALEVLTGVADAGTARLRTGMTFQDLAIQCRDAWWPSRGRSVDVAEQYFQKLRDYVIPVVGATTPIQAITARDWDRVLAQVATQTTNRGKPLSEDTIRKVKACFSSALTCAVANGELASNPIKGLSYSPNPLAEADRQGLDVEELDEDGPDKRHLSRDEVELLLVTAKGSLIYPVLVLQLAFGLRIAEALAVRWGDFAWAANELRVRAQAKRRRNPKWAAGMDDAAFRGKRVPKSILQRVGLLKSKSGRRDIHLFADALELMGGLPRGLDAEYVCPSEEGGLIEPRNAQRMYHELFVRAGLAPKKERKRERERRERAGMAEPTVPEWTGLPSPSSHSLRSWRLSYWANVVGLPASHLQRLAGHSRIETTMRYYVHSDNRTLSEWLSLANGGAAVPSPLASRSLLQDDPEGTGQPPRSG